MTRSVKYEFSKRRESHRTYPCDASSKGDVFPPFGEVSVTTMSTFFAAPSSMCGVLSSLSKFGSSYGLVIGSETDWFVTRGGIDTAGAGGKSFDI